MQAGGKVRVTIGNGASPVENFVTLGGVRLTEMELDVGLQDAGHAASGAWQRLLADAGTRQLRVNVEGVFEDSAAEETLRAVAFGGSGRNIQLLFGNGDRIEGRFMVQHYVRRGAVGELEEFSVVLHSAGTVGFVAG